MKKMFLTALVASLFTGCSIFGVYKVDIPQGTPLTQAQAEQVQVGMTHQQVRFLLGSPNITDPLNPQRWDYVYHYIPGTYAKKEKIPPVKGQLLKIYFNDQGIVTQIEGLNTLPTSQPGLPGSKETILTAPPL